MANENSKVLVLISAAGFHQQRSRVTAAALNTSRQKPASSLPPRYGASPRKRIAGTARCIFDRQRALARGIPCRRRVSGSFTQHSMNRRPTCGLRQLFSNIAILKNLKAPDEMICGPNGQLRVQRVKTTGCLDTPIWVFSGHVLVVACLSGVFEEFGLFVDVRRLSTVRISDRVLVGRLPRPPI